MLSTDGWRAAAVGRTRSRLPADDHVARRVQIEAFHHNAGPGESVAVQKCEPFELPRGARPEFRDEPRILPVHAIAGSRQRPGSGRQFVSAGGAGDDHRAGRVERNGIAFREAECAETRTAAHAVHRVVAEIAGIDQPVAGSRDLREERVGRGPEDVLYRRLGLVGIGREGKGGRGGGSGDVDVARGVHRRRLDRARQGAGEHRVLELRFQFDDHALVGCIDPGKDQVPLRVRHGGIGGRDLRHVHARQARSSEVELHHARRPRRAVGRA